MWFSIVTNISESVSTIKWTKYMFDWLQSTGNMLSCKINQKESWILQIEIEIEIEIEIL